MRNDNTMHAIARFGAAALILAFFSLASGIGILMAGQNRIETLISQNFGKTSDDIFGVSQSSPEHSPYFPNSSPAFCISSGKSEQHLYILDAMNGRVKKFTLAGNFVSQIPVENKEMKVETLCGISIDDSSDSTGIMIYSKKKIYFPDRDGRILKMFDIPENIDFSCVVRHFAGGALVYDASEYVLLETAFAGDKAAFSAVAEKITSPWLAGDGSLYSCRLSDFRTLLILKASANKKSASSEFYRFMAPEGERVSAPRIIGTDELSNVYVRRYLNLSEVFSVLAPSGKLLREFSLEPSMAGNRTNMYRDEFVDLKGNIYVAFDEKNRFVIKKIFNEN